MSRVGVRVLLLAGAMALAVFVALSSASPAFAYSEAECYTCHSGYSVHVAVGCYDPCHLDWGADYTGTITLSGSYHDAITSPCGTCHGAAEYPWVAVHTEAVTAAAHPTPTECAGCHSVLASHAGCDTCHKSADPIVVAAISSGTAACTACHASTHEAASSDMFNPNAFGYLSWDYAVAQDPTNNAGSPHGGYTASTNKCAVCHSVHGAVAGKSVLTAYGPYASYAQGCVACHGDSSTFTDVRMTANADGYISPHGTCTRCHVLNPHGAAGSVYPTLAAKLLNTTGDAAIAADIAAANNGLVADMFDGTASLNTQGLILGTGYLCSGCHQQAFAVNVAGANPNGGATGTTGHRVLASATSTWDGDVYGGSYGRDGVSANGTQTVAWNDAFGCDACHNAQAADGSSAFPHGYVDASSAVSPKTVAGSSYIWLTTASDATLSDAAILATTEPDSPILLTEDGLCLKCHRDGAGSGVGLSY